MLTIEVRCTHGISIKKGFTKSINEELRLYSTSKYYIKQDFAYRSRIIHVVLQLKDIRSKDIWQWIVLNIYYMSGIILDACSLPSHLISQQPFKVLSFTDGVR